MFRTGQNVPAADIDQYLPELRAYIKVHTQPEEKPEAGHPFLENVRYSRAPVFYEEPGENDMPVYPEEIRKDMSLLDSPAMKCCLGLKLNREEAEELMRLAGFSFSPSDPSDLVVMFCIEKEIWDLASVNYLMASFDIRDLEGVEPGSMM